MKTSRGYQSAGGFTLLEVLVAMTIVGIGVVTLLEVFSLGLRLGSKSTVQTEALAYGRLIMDNVLAKSKMEDGGEQGTYQEKGRWKLQVQTLREPTPSLNLGSNLELKEVALELSVDDGGRERRVELKTLRLVRKKP
ncbi:MAG: prepilin-type N-terminal cleavage/methylation domain-containing protein [Deltaproteobacteria bacterium]|nr:prepilin-type N-terminal cleavage/methylation domain-containing protein [Deltaproteobacteria bacterium]